MCSRTMQKFLLSLRTGLLGIAVMSETCFLLKACHARHVERHNASRLRRDAVRIGLLVPWGLHCNVLLLPVFQTGILMSHGRQSAQEGWFPLRFSFFLTTGLFFFSRTLISCESWLLCGRSRRLFARQVMRFILPGLFVYNCATVATMWCHRPSVRRLFRPATRISMVEWTRHFYSEIENFISLTQICARWSDRSVGHVRCVSRLSPELGSNMGSPHVIPF